MTVLTIGADIGNGTTSVANGDGAHVFFPSFVATTRRPYQGTGAATSTRHYITYKGINYVIGADALEMPGHDSLMAESLTEGEAYKRYLDDRSFAAFLAGISALYPDSTSLDINLGTGAPLSVYEPWGQTIRERYMGAHEYAYMGRSRSLNVRSAVVFGEGAEVLRLMPANQQVGKVAIHDIGSRTYNVLFFNDGTLKRARSFDAGIDRLFADIAIVSSDPGARWPIRQEMRRNPKSHQEIRAELNRSLVETLATIETKLAMSQADRHILLGGGAPDAMPIIKARYGKPVIVASKTAPETVNALAYAKAIEVQQ